MKKLRALSFEDHGSQTFAIFSFALGTFSRGSEPTFIMKLLPQKLHKSYLPKSVTVNATHEP